MKNLKSLLLGCKDIGIRKSDFVERTQLLWELGFIKWYSKKPSVPPHSSKNSVRYFFQGPHFSSTVTNKQYRFMPTVTCTDTSLIYLVTCRRCRLVQFNVYCSATIYNLHPVSFCKKIDSERGTFMLYLFILVFIHCSKLPSIPD